MKIACVILAAGASQRFGSDKMRYQIAGRQSMIELTADLYLSVFDRVSVVTSTGQAPEHPLVDWPNVQLVSAVRARFGISQSLIAGLQANLRADAVMIALGDMPYIEVGSIRKLCAAASPAHIVVPVSNGREGNPVIFGSEFFKQLQLLSGDVGAKSVIQDHVDRVRSVELRDAGIFRDIDRPEDLF